MWRSFKLFLGNLSYILTVENVDIDGGGLRVVRPADVLARVGGSGVLDKEGAAGLDAFFRDDADSSAGRVVANHLRRTIKRDECGRYQFASAEDEAKLFAFPPQFRASADYVHSKRARGGINFLLPFPPMYTQHACTVARPRIYAGINEVGPQLPLFAFSPSCSAPQGSTCIQPPMW